jgi:hypothetical protein
MGVVVFIPPQLAERVVKVRAMFACGYVRSSALREGKYTAGQIDARWSDEIEKDFTNGSKIILISCLLAKNKYRNILRKEKDHDKKLYHLKVEATLNNFSDCYHN